MNNYPPGVSGNEYAIAGPDFEEEVDGQCPRCGAGSLLRQGYQGSRWTICTQCDYASDSEDEDAGPDWDDVRDARDGF